MTKEKFPLVSVALATYNGQKYIEKQLLSLINQDYKNLEIVVSDDCSTDGTWSILCDYAKKDSRIRLLPREFNRGYVKNFIRVFKECRGELITPSDQDDIWHPEKIRLLIENIGDSTLIYSNNRLIDENDVSLNKTLFDLSGEKMITGSDPRSIIFCNTIPGHTTLFHKYLLDFLDDFKNLDSAPYIDWLIAFIAAQKGTIKYIHKPLVDWRQHSDSFTAGAQKENSLGRKARLKIEELNLNLFASFPGKSQDFIIKANKAWNAWRNSYLNLSMFIFVLIHGKITHQYHTSKFPAFKYLLGYKLKKIIRPNYYE